MVEILCFWHAGVRCAVPSRQALLIASAAGESNGVQLWDTLSAHAPVGEPRSVSVMTADGLKLLHVTQPVLEQVDANRVFGVSAALRQFLPLPHVVGVAEVEEELVWLVDARRLRSSSEGHGHRMPPAEPEGRDA